MLAPLLPRQRKALAAVDLIRRTTEELIARCKAMVDEEEVAAAAAAAEEGRDYMNAGVCVLSLIPIRRRRRIDQFESCWTSS